MAIDVSTLCLGILSFGDATGYEIKKVLGEQPFNQFLDASFGAIYPALARLNNDGLVACREVSNKGRPDRKIYSMTPQGRTALSAALSAQPAPDKFRSEFVLFLLFSEHMDRSRLGRMIDDKIEGLQERLANIDAEEDLATTKEERFVIGYGRAVHAAALKYLTETRHTLDETAAPGQGAVTDKIMRLRHAH